MAGAKGKSGGARVGSGGARAGAGAKPSAKTLLDRAFVGPRLPKRSRRVFATEEDRAAAKKERERKKSVLRSHALAQKRDVERALEGREKYARTTSYKKSCEHCAASFVAVISSGKYCDEQCRIDAGNLAAKNRAIDRRTERPCRCCGVIFTPEYGVKNKLQCSDECRTAYKAKIRQEALKKQISSDPVVKLTRAIRTFVCQAIGRGGYKKRSRTQEILGCDFGFFKSHIEKQFCPGMNWENRSDWHIDHIQPLAGAETEEEVIALNHYTNLRPLWAAENLSKGAQITHLI